jgi:hypothetical protein
MEKLEFTIMELRYNAEKNNFKLPVVGKFNLSVDELRDTIKDEIDNAFDEMKKNALGEFDHGIVVMPYIKANYKKSSDQES